MRYREDWERSRQRLEAFWRGEVLDRCCFSVTVTPPCPQTAPKGEAELLRQWTDAETIIAANRRRMERAYYGGDAFPNINLNLGAAGHAGFFRGSIHHFSDDTVWFSPILEAPDALEFDENSFLYRKTLELARAFAEDSRGDYIVSMSDCSGNADVLSHLLGPEALLVAMVDEPEAVEAGLKKVQPVYERIHREVYEIVRENNGGGCCISWLTTWGAGLHAQLQCDMSVMISNDLFERFVMPELRAQTALLDHSLYHLDGIQQVRHLDSLLSLERLQAIQWTQVVGQPPCTEFLPELRRIQTAGKSLLILAAPGQVRPLMENLSSRGLYLVTTALTFSVPPSCQPRCHRTSSAFQTILSEA